MPPWTPVKSSSIDSVMYDPDGRTLGVKFKSNPEKQYLYANVDADQAKSFVEADSLGHHFATEIRGKYEQIIQPPDKDPEPPS